MNNKYYGSSIITEADVKPIIHQEMMFQQPGEDYQEKILDYRAGKEARVKEKASQLEKVLPPQKLYTYWNRLEIKVPVHG